jgi:signal peptidase I
MYKYKSKDPFSKDVSPGKIFIRLLLISILSFLIAYALRHSLIFPHRISDFSMSPSIPQKKLMFFISKFRLTSLEYGTIVMAKAGESTDVFIGRIVGKPKDKISIRDKKVYRNGSLIKEETLQYTDQRVFSADISQRDQKKETTLKENYFIILCDNRDECMDSREYGPVHLEEIIGKKIW